MINHPIPINFLRHVYSESVSDVANILCAEAEDNYDTILEYLSNLHTTVGNWIEELKIEKDSKTKE